MKRDPIGGWKKISLKHYTHQFRNQKLTPVQLTKYYLIFGITEYCCRMPSDMSFNLQPTLKGHHLELRPLRQDDFDSLFTVASDPLIWEQHPDNDRYQEKVFKEFFRGAIDSGGAFLATSKEGRAIGSSRFHGYDKDRSEIEIGWTFLARSHWGGIYNGEMKRLMLDHAFQFVKNVIFVIGAQNLRSQKAIEKIGGVRIESKLDRGREKVVYQITASTLTKPSDPTNYISERRDL